MSRGFFIFIKVLEKRNMNKYFEEVFIKLLIGSKATSFYTFCKMRHQFLNCFSILPNFIFENDNVVWKDWFPKAFLYNRWFIRKRSEYVSTDLIYDWFKQSSVALIKLNEILTQSFKANQSWLSNLWSIFWTHKFP